MTYDPIPYATPVRPQIENDRRGGLMAFGIISILIGGIAGCMTLGALGGLVMFAGVAIKPDIRAVELAIAMVTYVGAAVLFIWVGVDSIRCRRWVRPVVLSLGWITIVGTVISLISMGMFLNDLPGILAPAAPPVVVPKGATVVVTYSAAPTTATMVIVMALGVVIGLIVPAAYVWFYSTANVKRTLEAYDPGPSWVERCSFPVFGACMALLIGALTTGPLALIGSTPFFGTFLDGAPAVALTLLAFFVMLTAVVLMFRMKAIGWWLALGVISLGFGSAVVTLGKRGMMEFYRRGRLSADDLALLEKSPTLNGVAPIIVMAATGAICVGYLLWVHRYFKRAARPTNSV